MFEKFDAENIDPKQLRKQRRQKSFDMNFGLSVMQASAKGMADASIANDAQKSPEAALMLEGIKQYQNHPFERAVEPLAEIWRQGEVSLQYCAASDETRKGKSILLVPSLINRSMILDLLPQKSFMRWLSAQGLDVYLLDWGEPVQDEGLASMEALAKERFIPAIEFLSLHVAQPLYALGYCMGGTLLASIAAQVQSHFQGLIFLASPWDFHAGQCELTEKIKLAAPAARQIIDDLGYLPASWIQSVFAAVNADKSAKKFTNFMQRDMASDEAKLFVAVEDWLNDGVDLPGDVARVCIDQWYVENALMAGIDENIRRLNDVALPSLIVTSKNDRLVPKEFALAIGQSIAQAEVIVAQTGHIGMMTGSAAATQIWEPILAWVDSLAVDLAFLHD